MRDDLVHQSYDQVADAYLAQRDQSSTIAYLERFIELLLPHSRVLDIGCGAGLPVDLHLLEHGFQVIGLDVSPRQIELARQHNPSASYEVKDMQLLTLGEYTVDAVVSFYAIFHIPREQHRNLFEVLRSYLPVGGLLLVTMGSTDWEGVDDFHGVPMFWSHYDAPTNRALVEDAGFDVSVDEIDTSDGERHQVILARAIPALINN